MSAQATQQPQPSSRSHSLTHTPFFLLACARRLLEAIKYHQQHLAVADVPGKFIAHTLHTHARTHTPPHATPL